MNEENSREVSASERDRCLSIMADQQIQFDKFRENVNGRLTNLERRQTRKASSFLDLDFEKLWGLILCFILALVFTRVAIWTLDSYRKRGLPDGNLSVSGT
jgi:hypothetical protein